MKKDQNQVSRLPSGEELAERVTLSLNNRLEALFVLKKQAAGRLDAEVAHDLRVASRRLRAAVDLLGPFLAESGLTDAGRPVRRITRSLGDLRNLDEAIQFFQSVGMECVKPLLEQLLQERHAESEKVLKQLKAVDKERLRQQLRQATRGVSSRSAAEMRGLIIQLSEQNLRLFRPIHSMQTLAKLEENVEERHAMRIAIKKWRYFTELIEQLFMNDMSDLLERLKRYQTVLGAMNDRAGFLQLVKGADKLTPVCKAELETKLSKLQQESMERFHSLLDKEPLQYLFRV